MPEIDGIFMGKGREEGPDPGSYPLPLMEVEGNSQDREGRGRRFTDLCRLVQGCRACPRMEGRRRVLSPLNGQPGSLVMFIAEAPGRNGADRTGIPIYGDPTGANFNSLLDHAGFTREQVFVTNCVLCNPRDQEGRNDTPTEEEIRNCSFHLEMQIRVVDPLVVVTLGNSPLRAVELVQPHGLRLNRVVGKTHEWFGRFLVPLYHPSPRAQLHRSFSKQQQDFMNLAELVRGITSGLVQSPLLDREG